jgi:hypothetical protein
MMNMDNLHLVYTPIKIGTILAMIISWNQHKSILMALVHGAFGWLYIIYYYVGKE